MTAAKTLLVLGGGVSGLSTAFLAQEKLAPQVKVKLVEASPRLGGWIRTSANYAERGGYVFESGPHSIRMKSETHRSVLKLFDKLNLLNALVPAGKHGRKRSVYINVRATREGAVRPLTLPIMLLLPLTWKAIFRDIHQLAPLKPPEDESLFDFFRRRFGSEVLPYVDAFASGIYAGNIRCLSAKSVFPKLYEYERSSGGILKGLWKDRSGSSLQSKSSNSIYGIEIPRSLRNSLSSSVTLPHGLEFFINELAERLETRPLLNTRATEFKFDDNKFVVTLSNQETIRADRIISALPSYELTKLIRPHSNAIADMLDDIDFTDVAVVNMAWKLRNRRALLRYGFGYLIPGLENQPILGTILVSNFSKSHAGSDPYIMTVMMGGENFKGVLEHSPEELLNIAKMTVGRHLKDAGFEELIDSQVHIHRKSIPQYNIGHSKRLAKIESGLQSYFGNRLQITGNSFYGVGVSDCIAHADRLVDDLEM